MTEVFLSFIGFGNVGRGVARVLLEKAEQFRIKYGLKFRVVSISDSKATIWEEGGIDLREALMVKETFGSLDRWGNDYEVYQMSPMEVVKEVESDVVVDVTNDVNAWKWHMEAFRHGRHVVTSNKPPLVFHFMELTQEAYMRRVNYRFEATVMAGTPIITLLQESLLGDEILSIQGVLNGTTTFILSQMERGLSFEDALKKAQELGIAERDSSTDIKGIDAAYKAAILHNVAFYPISFEKLRIRGIAEISMEDIERARREGKAIRLVAEVKKGEVSVEPKTVPKDSPLAVYGTQNVAVIETDLLGKLVIKGGGAGVKETASAVVNDVIKAVRRE
ncbi:homoserine dehydrogenase [Thermococcus paralvinellae]|uniref:Homoserine dehydrogenase n=1 Tax=Thermococcus paralvinellae TaxID=582419 RepID=W0I0K5_9EURY|nr:homoserine dehydrogenase [Thermococcus paralvinellae]AHF79581.1 homoserine dehydrogenase [Thermococcus paralvinellae]